MAKAAIAMSGIQRRRRRAPRPAQRRSNRRRASASRRGLARRSAHRARSVSSRFSSPVDVRARAVVGVPVGKAEAAARARRAGARHALAAHRPPGGSWRACARRGARAVALSLALWRRPREAATQFRAARAERRQGAASSVARTCGREAPSASIKAVHARAAPRAHRPFAEGAHRRPRWCARARAPSSQRAPREIAVFTFTDRARGPVCVCGFARRAQIRRATDPPQPRRRRAGVDARHEPRRRATAPRKSSLRCLARARRSGCLRHRRLRRPTRSPTRASEAIASLQKLTRALAELRASRSAA